MSSEKQGPGVGEVAGTATGCVGKARPTCSRCESKGDHGCLWCNNCNMELPGRYDFRDRGRAACSTFVDRSTEVLRLFGAPHCVRVSWAANVRRLCESEDVRLFASKAKKLCEYFTACLLRTPCDRIEFTGHFHHWIRNRISGKATMRKLSLCESLFAMKAVTGYAGDLETVSSLHAHADRCAASVPNDSQNEHILWGLEKVLSELGTRLEAIWPTWRVSQPPSASGAVGSPRILGGKNGWATRSAYGFEVTPGGGIDARAVYNMWLRHSEDKLMEFPQDPVQSFERHLDPRWDMFPVSRRTPGWNCLLEDADVTWHPGAPDASGRIRMTPHCVWPRTNERWHELATRKAMEEVLNGDSDVVHVSAVVEAGRKVRVVTKGSPWAAYVTNCWRETVFRELAALPCLPCMRGQIDGSMVDAMLKGAPMVASSDFRNASDLLNPQLTNRILSRLCRGFPWSLVVMDDNHDKEMHYGVLPVRGREGGWVVWDEDTCTDGTDWVRDPVEVLFDWGLVNLRGQYRKVTKRCGQLMGQATSFALLCLVNIGCSITAYARQGIPRHVSMHYFFVNGDDRLAWTSPLIEKEFWILADAAGLQRSTGKSHEHSSMAVINGQRYLRRRGTFSRVFVLRAGLAFGITKLEEESKDFRPEFCITPFFAHAPVELHKPLADWFIRENGLLLKEHCGWRYPFLEPRLGGFGQVRPEYWPVPMTKLARQTASVALQSAPLHCGAFGPLLAPGWDIRPPPSAPWDVVTAPWDDGSPALEQWTFRQRRVQAALDSGLATAAADRAATRRFGYWLQCCDKMHDQGTDRCRVCQTDLVDCRHAKPRVRYLEACSVCRQPGWDRLHDSVGVVDDDPCTHRALRIDLVCGCHGLNTRRAVRKGQELMSEAALMSLSKLRLTTQFHRPSVPTATDPTRDFLSSRAWNALASQGAVLLPEGDVSEVAL